MCASPFSLREIAVVTTDNTQWEVNRKGSSPLTELLTPAHWRGSLCTHLLSSILNSAHYVLVAGAAADIALEAFAYLSFCRVGIVLEYLIGSHYHSRSTEATLQTVFLPEAFLDWVQATLGGKSFNSCHFTAIDGPPSVLITFDFLSLPETVSNRDNFVQAKSNIVLC